MISRADDDAGTDIAVFSRRVAESGAGVAVFFRRVAKSDADGRVSAGLDLAGARRPASREGSTLDFARRRRCVGGQSLRNGRGPCRTNAHAGTAARCATPRLGLLRRGRALGASGALATPATDAATGCRGGEQRDRSRIREGGQTHGPVGGVFECSDRGRRHRRRPRSDASEKSRRGERRPLGERATQRGACTVFLRAVRRTGSWVWPTRPLSCLHLPPPIELP